MNGSELLQRMTSRETGIWGMPARGVLRACESAYAAAVAVRNAHYDRNGPRVVLPVPVISVGNLTVGGTGKTPFVIDLLERLARMRRTPAVVSRGYKSGGGLANDEERMIQRRVPGAICVSSSDRASAGEAAFGRRGADVIVLDDGFQHRQMGRTLDIVLIDATCPFGSDHLLPLGLLREPAAALRRADAVVITRCDQVSPTSLLWLDARVRELAGDVKHMKCKHVVIDIQHLDGTKIDESPRGKRAVLFAGIARPAAFAATVGQMGIEVVGHRWWPDHHAYSRRDIDDLFGTGRFPPHDWLLTTEKDAVKISGFDGLKNASLRIVRVAIDFIDDGDTMLQTLLDQVLQKS